MELHTGLSSIVMINDAVALAEGSCESLEG
jgi:hypothetical protein